MDQKFQDFVNEVIGKPIEVEDPSNPDQCMDLAFYWLDKLGIDRAGIRHVRAYQVWEDPNDITIRDFEYIPNTPNGVPQKGDLVILNTSVNPKTGAGHICIATGEGNSTYFKSVDQNWTKMAGELVTHNYSALQGYGWLRPRKYMPTPTPQITDSTKIPQLGNHEVQDLSSRFNAIKTASNI